MAVVLPKGIGDTSSLLKRYSAAKSAADIWRSLHQEAMDYATPQRETFTQHSPGQRKGRFVYDSTAVEGSEQFASRIQGSLVPSWQQWVDLVSGSEIPEEDKQQVDKLLAEATEKMFANLNHSNFDTEITPSFKDLSIGTGAILIEEAEFGSSSAFKFTNVPLAELKLEPSGNPWREQKVAAAKIPQTWPEADIPTELQKILDKDPNKEVNILNGMVRNQENKTWIQVVIWKKQAIFSQEFKTQRLIVFRWSVTPGETYGRGPAIHKLPDIRTANKIVELTLGNAALQMSGLYTGRSDGIFNPHTVRIAPGSIIPVGSNDSSNPTLSPLTPSGNLGIAEGTLEMMQNNIRKAFFSDPLGELTDPVRSATENIIRNQEFLKQSGASIGRLKTELIEPLVSAMVDILKELGQFPEINVNGQEVTIKQVSPLAQSENIEQFQNTQLWMATMAGFLPPEVIAAKVKVEELPSKFQQQLAVDPDLVRTKEETKELAQQVQSAAAQRIQQGGANETGV